MVQTGKTRLCCAIIECAYMLQLPKSYPHDVAHTCCQIMQQTEDVRFVVGYRTSGVEYMERPSDLDTRRKVFGPMLLYVFIDDGNGYKAIPVDETSAFRHLSGLSLQPPQDLT